MTTILLKIIFTKIKVKTMTVNKKMFIIALLSFCLSLSFAQGRVDWIKEEEKARTLYRKGKTDEAIILFREIILSSNNEEVKRESYFWIAQAYMNANRLKLAEVNLEFYLKNYKDEAKNYSDAIYQKGRLLFLQEEYQSCVEQMNIFIKSYPGHRLVANGYYWIGEALFALGQFDDSALFFKIVLNKYPESYKRDASNYKIRLIEHKKSELALQNLIKWSQEQFLATLNKLKVKERTLEEALLEYEKGGGTVDGAELEQLSAENAALKNTILEMENRIKMLELSAADATGDLSGQIEQLQLKEQLLNQKEAALKLLEKKLREKESALE